MEYAPFGKTGIKVSRLVLGTWYLPHSHSRDEKGVFPVDRKKAEEVIRKAYDLGINFFDTADVYRGVYNRSESSDFSKIGYSERVLGETLKGYDRESFVIATKAMGRTGPGPNDAGLNRKHLRNAIERSLERLGMDYVDIYLMHAPDRITAPDISVRSMNQLIMEGRILHYAASNHSPVEIEQMCVISEKNALEAPSGVQEVYNMIDRSFEADMLQTVKRHDAGAMIYSPLAQGVLAGRYLLERQGVARQDYEEHFEADSYRKASAGVQRLSEFAKSKGATMSQIALAWLLAKDRCIFPIVGASSQRQLEENVEACNISLTDDEVVQLDSWFNQVQD